MSVVGRLKTQRRLFLTHDNTFQLSVMYNQSYFMVNQN